MSVTTGTFPGIRIVDMPDLGAASETSSVVGERAGSGRFTMNAIANYASNTVMRWGAIGDGFADDTSAIQAAANAGVVIFPAGTYRITAAISIPPGVSVIGVGPASIIAPATAGQAAFNLINAVITDEDVIIRDIQIAPSAANCIGIRAVFCRYLTVQDVTFTGCAGNSIDFDRCEYYTIADCWVRSSMAFLGGTVLCQSSVWNSVTGGFLGGNATISRVRFAPLTGSEFGSADPCIHVVSQPVTHIDHCSLAWGAYGAGPISFIVLENQCQGNIISDNVCLGVNIGIVAQPGSMANNVMPTYITITDNAVDSFGGIGIYIDGNSGQPGIYNNIRGNYCTEPQQICTAAAVNAGGSGYAVNDLLAGPAVPAGQEGTYVRLRVTSVGGGGAVTGVSIYNGGLTQTTPVNPITFAGGGGSGATFNLTYGAVASAFWLKNVDQNNVLGNFVQTYGGNRVGFGVVMQDVSNSVISDNHISEVDHAIYAFSGVNANIVFTRNVLVYNNTADFGGNIPTFSIIQNNIAEPWLTTTPAMPASGVVVTNTAPYDQQVIIAGGTVTAVTYNGATIVTNTAGQAVILILSRQHSISITYSVAPSWTWIPMI